MIYLTRGVPATESFATEAFIQAFAEALRADSSVLLQYGKAKGYQPLLESIAKREGVSSDEIISGNSSLELLYFVTRSILQPGDRVLVESPTYDRTLTLLRRSGMNIGALPLEADGVSLEAFEAELKQNKPRLVYLIADFQNPTGKVLGAEKRQQIANWAREYDFLIVEDAPYRQLRYFGNSLPSLKELAPEKVLQMSSFSKLMAPGLRLGYIVAPKDLIAQIASYSGDTYIGPVTPTQGMVQRMIDSGALDKNIEALKALYRPRMVAMTKYLKELLPEFDFAKPEGGFFIGAQMPESVSIETLIPRAKEAGLMLSDGRGFFADPAKGEHFIRLPFCSLSESQIEEAIQTLQKVIRN